MRWSWKNQIQKQIGDRGSVSLGQMNELQKALMRRRNLNGEIGGKPGETAPAVGDGAAVPTASPPVIVRKETVKPADPKPSTSAASELQAKLARRRGLNGEIAGSAGSTAPTAPATTESEVAPSAVESPAVAARTDTLEQQPAESTKPITPAWLTETHDRISEVTSTDPANSGVQQGDPSHNPPDKSMEPEATQKDKDTLLPPEHIQEGSVLSSSAESDHNHRSERREEPTLRTIVPVEAASSTREAESESVDKPVASGTVGGGEQPPLEEVGQGLPQSVSEQAQATEPTPAMHSAAEATQVSAPEPAQEPQPQPMGQLESHSPPRDAIPALDTPLELQPQPLPQMVPPPTQDRIQMPQPELQPQPQCEEAHHHMHASTEVPTIPTTDEQAAILPPPAVSAVDPATIHAPARLSVSLPDAPHIATDPHIASEAPTHTAPAVPAAPSQPNPSSASTKSASPVTSAQPRDSSPVPSSSPLWRSRTSTGSADATSPKSSRSPLRRTTSLSGSQSAPAKRSSWYPGKYLLEGGWSSKNSSPRGQSLSMDPQAARDHYAALLTASALEYPEEKLLATAAEHRAAMEASGGRSTSPLPGPGRGGGTRQRDEELKAAQLPDMVAAGASDDTIDMVLELSRENASLKREVAHLKAELARAQALIKSLTPPNGADGVTLTEGGEASVLEGKNEGSDKSSLPSSAAPSLSKAKSFSRRFGARSYYSNYDSSALNGVGDDETDEGLFGEIDALSADRRQRMGTNSGSQYKFGIDALTADVDDVLGEGGAVTPKRQSSKGEFGSRDDGTGTGLDGGNAPSAAESSEQNLDMLLKSVTSSGHKERRAAADSERYLVQSFMSTSTITPKESTILRERGHSGERTSSDLPNRLAGLISSDAKDQLFERDDGQVATPSASGNPTAADTMDYSEFVGKLKRSADLAIMIRDFILSVLGPNGDGTAPAGRRKPQLHYIFYGTHKLDIRCRQFFDSVQDQLPTWPEFQDLTDERLICARDGIEQYVMTRIGEYAFKSVLDSEGDELLLRRMKLLSFVKPEMLGINAGVYNEMLLAIATDELRKINKSRTPAEKAACVVKTVTLILRSLSLSKTVAQADRAAAAASASGEGQPKEDQEATYAGADDLVPLFIWVVLRSHIPLLSSNVNYVMTYLNPARMMGQSGYCITQLSSAVQFVKYAEPDQFLLIEPNEFEAKLMLAEKQLNGGF